MSLPRIVFLGTGEIAGPVFRWLMGSATPPVALVTQPDRPAGRRRELRAPFLKSLALEMGMTVLQPTKIRDPEALEQIREQRPDLIVVMAYGQILPQALIDLAMKGCVNLHASLLPKYRGAACIQAAIDAGDSETGVTLMHVVRQLDAGDVILAKSMPIGPADTGGSVHDRLAELAVDAMRDGLPLLLDGRAPRFPQAELGEVSHVPKLDRDDGRIDWNWSADRIARRIRAYEPWPGCWCVSQCESEPRRLKVFPVAGTATDSVRPGAVSEAEGEVRVGCGEGCLVLGEVQSDGARRMTALDWWRGLRVSGVGRLD